MMMIVLEDIFLRPYTPETSISNITLHVTCCFPETVSIQVTALHKGNGFESIRILLKNPSQMFYETISLCLVYQSDCGNAAFCICNLICQELQQYPRDAAC